MVLEDDQVVAKLTTIMRAANKDLMDQVSSPREEVRGLKTALADRDDNQPVLLMQVLLNVIL